jgi:mRNA interferase HigB
VKLLNRVVIEAFKERHADARSQIDAWVQEVNAAVWQSPHQVKQRYPSASFLGDAQVIFNIKGNHYRLRVRISYKNQIVFIEKAGTHQEYMKW